MRLYKRRGRSQEQLPHAAVVHLECNREGSLVLATYYRQLSDPHPQCRRRPGRRLQREDFRARRQVPRRLKLKPEDYQRIKQKDARFTKARFDQEEKFIIACLG